MKFRIGIKQCICMGLLAAGLFLLELLPEQGNNKADSMSADSMSADSMSADNVSVIARLEAGQQAADGAEGTTDEAVTESKGKIALTFDDGPHPYYTKQLLDGLKERHVKASFFILGAHAEASPELVERMAEEGHLIGNHTYNHVQLTKVNEELFKEEIRSTSEMLEEITGEAVEYIRPPFGSWDKKFEEELNMFPVLWTVDPLDWCSSNSDSVVRKVVSAIEENDIILMHDEYKTSVTAALAIVDILQKEGYEFVTVDEILFD